MWNDRKVVVETLGEIYAEEPPASGIIADGAVLVLFTVGKGKTWAITVNLSKGQSRNIATGERRIPHPMLAKGRVS